jgi:hypothetical protein
MIDRKRETIGGLTETALDLGAVVGFGFFLYGLHLIYHPLAPLVGGLIVAGGCLLAGYDRMRRSRP